MRVAVDEHGGPQDLRYAKEENIQIGYFHRWMDEWSGEEPDQCRFTYGIVELQDGQVVLIPPHLVQFVVLSDNA